jgi:hypothetical protein
LFVIFIISAASAALSSLTIYMTGYPFLLFIATGYLALILTLGINLFGIALLAYAIWKRFSWTWIYGACLLGFFIVNSLFSLAIIPQRIAAMSRMLPSTIAIPGFNALMYKAIIVGVIFGTAVNILFLALMYWKRDYFKK